MLWEVILSWLQRMFSKFLSSVSSFQVLTVVSFYSARLGQLADSTFLISFCRIQKASRPSLTTEKAQYGVEILFCCFLTVLSLLNRSSVKVRRKERSLRQLNFGANRNFLPWSYLYHSWLLLVLTIVTPREKLSRGVRQM